MSVAGSNAPYVPLLSWKKAQESVPWNIILLLGGGFSMAKACEVTLKIASVLHKFIQRMETPLSHESKFTLSHQRLDQIAKNMFSQIRDHS